MLNLASLYFYLFAGKLRHLAADDKGQTETTEMLLRMSLAIGIILLVGALLYTAITQLGQDVSGDIGGGNWGG